MIASRTASSRSSISLFVAWMATTLAIAAWAYHRGLSGDFLFDDFANLPALGAFGPVDNWTAFTRYITSGTADPTGRPLSLLTFLIDAHNWPADPYPFKRTNLLLHLLNGALLALVLRRLGRVFDSSRPRHADTAALLAAALWLLHPLFVSTTMYVVQREAILPATFTLLGLLGYLHARRMIVAGRAGGLWLAAASIGVATILATASKANGILLPLLAWIVETLILEARQTIPLALRARFIWVRRLTLDVPSALLLAWLATQAWQFTLYGTGPFRPWTLPERVMTEARVLCEYLGLLWIPHPYTAGLFNDAVVISRGLLSPPSTLAAIVVIAMLLAAAAALRSRFPAFALAVFFFFAGQLLESSVIPLELYYEHRNYLPALLMFWPLALWIMDDRAPLPGLRHILTFVLPLLLAAMTSLNADLWGNAQEQALVWAEKNPHSPRAQAYAAAAEQARGRPDLAAARTQRARVEQIEDIQVALNLVGAQCQMGRVDPAALDRARLALRTSRAAGRTYYNWMGEVIREFQSNTACAGLGAAEINSLLDAMAQNPRMRTHGGWRQDNLSLRAALALAGHDAQSALADFNRALEEDPRVEVALAQAAQLGAAGYPAQGLAHLDHYESLPRQTTHWTWSMAGVHAWLLERQGYMRSELANLRRVLEEDVRANKETSE